MEWSQAQKELAKQLEPAYGNREAGIIADWVMERLTGQSKLERLLRKTEQLGTSDLAVYERFRDELLAGRPVQYVLGEAWFGGMKFFVDERVLIPRPETEELVEWMIGEAPGSGMAAAQAGAGVDVAGVAGTEAFAKAAGAILDVGTGSGCIAITLRRRLPGVDVYACDVSNGALAVAEQNAEELGAAVGFLGADFLNRSGWDSLPAVQWVVSNPPYIPLKERASMATHVIDAEPALALFVPDDDALVFYRALGEFAGRRMGVGGVLFAEVHEGLGGEVRDLLLGLGAVEVVLRKDLQGKDRMIKARW
jgi:release factor glutamine methyltransferase